MGRRNLTKRRIRGGKPKRRLPSRSSGRVSVRRKPIIDTTSGKRRRIDPGYPFDLAKLTRTWSSGGYHSYRIDELNILLDKVKDIDLKDIEVDLGAYPVIVAMKAGWNFAGNIAPNLDMSVAGRFTELVGVTLATAGSAMIKLSMDKRR